MASESPDPPDGFTEVEEPDGKETAGSVSLSPGEQILGVLLDVTEEASQYDNHLYKFRDEERGTVEWWGNSQVNRRYDSGAFEAGDRVCVQKTTETETFEDDDGEEKEAAVFRVFVA